MGRSYECPPLPLTPSAHTTQASQGALELEVAGRQLAEGREKDHYTELEASRGRLKDKADEIDQMCKAAEVRSEGWIVGRAAALQLGKGTLHAQACHDH